MVLLETIPGATWPGTWPIALLVVGYILFRLFFAGPKLPDIPIIGVREGEWFPIVRARWRNALNFKAAVLRAENEFGGRTTFLPIAGSRDVVLLPRSETQFVTDQPESVLSMHEEVMHTLQTDYTCADPSLIHNPVHHKLITTTLTNQVGNLVPDVVEETIWAFDQHWGSPEEYKEICLYETMVKIIGGVTNRVFVGVPKCRDPELLRLGMAYAKLVPLTAQVLRSLWKPVRAAVALVSTIPVHLTTRKFTAILRPEIERRLAAYDARQRDPEDKSIEPERNDFLQWSIDQAKAGNDPHMWKTSTLATRVLLLNFAAIHTSSFSITSVILDLVASKPEYIEELRAEIQSVLAEHNGEWNKRALARMEKLDSVFRESARLNSFVTVGLPRRVVAKDGITTPSGVKIPCGATVAVPSYAVLLDDDVYPDASTFNPFRFSDERSNQNVDYIKRAAKSFATTSTEYLAFGHGRNACPGRFFAANELKIMLAHVVLNYDFEMKESRPRNKWFGMVRVPPMQATVKIRRRVNT